MTNLEIFRIGFFLMLGGGAGFFLIKFILATIAETFNWKKRPWI